MSSYATSFSVAIAPGHGRGIQKKPAALAGKTEWVDTRAAAIIRGAQGQSKDILLSQEDAFELAKSLRDGGRVSRYEQPVYAAAMAAAQGKDVFVTDSTGHYRRMGMNGPAARAFTLMMDGVKGT